MSATTQLLNLIKELAKFGYALGLGLAVLYLIISGFKYVQGGGKNISDVRNEILFLVAGVILIIASFAIPTIIRSFAEK